MSDLTLNTGATDLFALGGNWKAQSSSTTTDNTYVTIENPNGDTCEESTALDVTTRYSCVYRYCGGVDFGGDLDTALLSTFGAVKNSKLVDSVSVSFQAGEFPEVQVEGHNHAQNAHDSVTNPPATFDGSGIITWSNEGIGVEDFLSIGSGDACVISGNINFELDHNDRVCGDGDHAVGINTNGRVSLSLEYLGGVTGSPAGWVVDSTTVSDESKEIDTTSVQAHKFLTRN